MDATPIKHLLQIATILDAEIWRYCYVSIFVQSSMQALSYFGLVSHTHIATVCCWTSHIVMRCKWPVQLDEMKFANFDDK